MKALSVLFFTLFTSITHGVEGELKFATQDFGPFHYESDSGPKGPIVDIVLRACELMETKCSVTLYPWRRALMLAERAKVDGLFVLGRNRSREAWLHFTLPIARTEYGFFVPFQDNKEYSELLDFSGYRVAVFGPSNTSRSLENVAQLVGEMTIEMGADDIEGFKKLNVRRVQAVYSNRSVGDYIIAKNQLTGVRFAYTHRVLDYYVGFPKLSTSREVVDKFNDALLYIYYNGEIHSILISHGLTPSNLRDYKSLLEE
ncbi:substrate-binding periplasmic protein [Hahella ganghwensis]|uniref:substrate-binding periplasmic protein n=1 Tax=Hahella ganghwensis TaxID=286420 RepID=UPI0003698D3D|nr:transporter substrate-binding domain-containing protein [Hahella ganghwensis]